MANALQSAVDKACAKDPCPVDFEQRQARAKQIADAVSKKCNVKVFVRSYFHRTNGVQAYFNVPTFDAAIRGQSGEQPGEAKIVDIGDD